MNWSTLRSEIRYELKDTGGTPKWADAELLVYCNDALRDYSDYFPLESSTSVAGSSGVYAIPSGTIEVRYVEDDGNFYEPLERKPGVYRKYATGWYQSGTNIVFLPTSDAPANLTLHTTSIHTLITGDASVFTVPDIDLELIKLFIMAKATRRLSMQTANLDRFTEGGWREDNPVIPLHAQYWNAYLEKINRRLAGTRIQFYVPGRGR